MSPIHGPSGGSFIPFEREELNQSIPDRFEKIVSLYPHRLAIQSSRGLTYDELNLAANRVAHALLHQSGEIQEPVGLVVEDECLAVAAILGVLKAAKFYVPLDRSIPAVSLSALLQDCPTRIFITESRHCSWLHDLTGGGATLICIDELDSTLSTDNVRLVIPPAATATLVYTSGSTGRPKGVIQNHHNLLHRVMLCTNSFAVGNEDRFSLVSSLTYSASLRSLFSALLNGAALFPFNILKEGTGQLGDWLSRRSITIYFSVPSVFRRWVSSLTGTEDFSRLRVIDLGGESVINLDVDLYKRHFPANCVLVNNLGSNEAGTMRLFFIGKTTEITERIVPVGYAVDDKEILILNDKAEELGFGQVGEIAVRSVFLSPGYWRRPDLTAAVFRTDPKNPELRTYHTGDLGCILPDGCLLYKGRNQFRAKIRGIGVEILEIEEALHSHPSIQEAAVTVREEDSAEQRLIACVVAKKHANPTPAEIRKFLAERLPAQMIPSVFMWVNPLPRTVQGKIDRRALSGIHPDQPSTDAVTTTQDPVERSLKMIWETVLGVSPIGVQSNFFDLGGDSLTALQMITAVEKAFGKSIPPAAVFQAPTIQGLAAVVREEQAVVFWSSLVPVQPIGSKPPFFWVHGDSSSVFLSRYLGADQPLYLLTHQSEDGRPARFTEVETIAEYYLQQILTVQITGPFFLGGYSFGCVVALEIAQRIIQRQEQVGLLMLLDPPPFNLQHHSSSSPRRTPVRQHMRALAGLTAKEQIGYVLPRFTDRLNSWTMPMQRTFYKKVCQLCVALGYRIPVSQRSDYILDIYQKARTRYAPQPYSGRVLLFKGKTRSYHSKSDWDDLLKGETETHQVSTDHNKLRVKSEVHSWAEKLKPALLKAQAAHSPSPSIVRKGDGGWSFGETA